MYKTFLTSEIRGGSAGSRNRTAAYLSNICLIEHEVTIGGGSSGIEIVARFIHALPPEPRRGFGRNHWRGGLVGLTLRRIRNSTKRIGANATGPTKFTFRLRAIAITPQTPVAMGGSPSPVAGPIPVSVTSSGVVPIVSIPEAAKEAASPPPSVPSPVTILPEQSCPEVNTSSSMSFPASLSPDASASQTSSWLRAGRFQSFESTFASFSAADILRLSRDDLIQICGLADGIRLFNALHSKPPAPRLTLYFAAEGNGSLWRAIYLDNLTSTALASKLHGAIGALGQPHDRLHSVLLLGPQGIHVLVTDDLVANMKDESMYIIEIIKDTNSERYKMLLKPSSR